MHVKHLASTSHPMAASQCRIAMQALALARTTASAAAAAARMPASTGLLRVVVGPRRSSTIAVPGLRALHTGRTSLFSSDSDSSSSNSADQSKTQKKEEAAAPAAAAAAAAAPAAEKVLNSNVKKHEFKAETRRLLDIVASSLYSEKVCDSVCVCVCLSFTSLSYLFSSFFFLSFPSSFFFLVRSRLFFFLLFL